MIRADIVCAIMVIKMPIALPNGLDFPDLFLLLSRIPFSFDIGRPASEVVEHGTFIVLNVEV